MSVDLTEWVASNLSKMKDQPDMEVVRIRWECPNCGKKYKMKLPWNKYVGRYVFECKECKYVEEARYLHCFQS